MNKIVRILTIFLLFFVVGVKTGDITNVLFVNDSEKHDTSFELDGIVQTGPRSSERQVVCKAALGLQQKTFCLHYNMSPVSSGYINFRIQNLSLLKLGEWLEVSAERCPYLIVKMRKAYQADKYPENCVLISLEKDGTLVIDSDGPHTRLDLQGSVLKYKTEINAERIARLYNFVHKKPFYIKEKKRKGYTKEDIRVLEDDIKFVDMLTYEKFWKKFEQITKLPVNFLYGSNLSAEELLKILRALKEELEGN